jgi:putative restriction endonuclease
MAVRKCRSLAVLSAFPRTCKDGIEGRGKKNWQNNVRPGTVKDAQLRPWSKDPQFRTDPRNGLCPCATFDRLFECGLVTISDDLYVIISNRLRKSGEKIIAELTCIFHGAATIKPRRFPPLPAHLEWHRINVFKD